MDRWIGRWMDCWMDRCTNACMVLWLTEESLPAFALNNEADHRPFGGVRFAGNREPVKMVRRMIKWMVG